MEYPVHVHDLRISDPCIMPDPVTHKYYIYARSFSFGVTEPRDKTDGTFYAIVSEDLIHWSNPILVFEQGDFWAGLDYWAPEGRYYNGKYYIFSSFRAPGTVRRCQALISDDPLGPFVPLGEPLTPEGWQSLDGHLYIDLKNRPWLVFCHEWTQVYDGQMCAVPLADDLSHAVGDPMILFRASEAPWGDDFVYSAGDGGEITDGPWLHRMEDGSLVMLWSTHTPYGYAVGIAKSKTGEIYGPWEQFDKPIFCHDGGHASLFRRFDDGMLMMPLHVFGKGGPGMRVLIYEVEECNGLIETVNEFTGNWFDAIGGHPAKYRSAVPCRVEPEYTRLANYGGPFARRGLMSRNAPESKYHKGKLFKDR